jgi:hypothetical protein
MARLWTPAALVCRVCGQRYPLHRSDAFQRHISDCVDRHADYIDELRTDEAFEGDPELGLFARTEGDVYNRRPGTRKRPR